MHFCGMSNSIINKKFSSLLVNKNQLLGISSAFLLWLSWPPIPFTSPLLLIALVPLLLAVEHIIQSDQRKKGAKIFWLCAAVFFLWNATCTYWIFNSLCASMSVWIAALVILFPFGTATLLMTSGFWLYYRLRLIMPKIWAYIGLICFWIGYEFLYQSWDAPFPWMNLGNGFAQSHQLIQWYEYTGVYGGTLWILIVNILIFDTLISFLSKGEKDKYKFLSGVKLSMLVALTPMLISLMLYFNYQEKSNPSNVVVVQPNINPYMKYTVHPAVQTQNLIHLSDSIGQVNTEYFIWPETAIPDFSNEDSIHSNTNYLTIRSFLNKYKNGNVVSGIESYLLYNQAKTSTAHLDEYSGKYIDSFNAAIQIENADKVQFYHKSKLVPGVETLPFASLLGFLKPVFASLGGATGRYGRQETASVFYSQSGIGLAPVICYESIWGGYVATYIKLGAQFIAIMTNDGWWGNTSGKNQHLEYAKLRAIETRRWVARSANTGISAFINQRGDVVKQSKWWVPTALKADINLNDELTFYVKSGDYIAYAGSFGCGIFGLIIFIGIFRTKKTS